MYPLELLAKDISEDNTPQICNGFAGITLAYNVEKKEDVRLDLDISIVSSSTVILTSVVKAILAFITIRMPFVMPELWEKSKFYISDGKLKFACILGGLVATLQVVLLVVTSSHQEIIGNITILVFSVIYAILRNKKVKMEVSYE